MDEKTKPKCDENEWPTAFVLIALFISIAAVMITAITHT